MTTIDSNYVFFLSLLFTFLNVNSLENVWNNLLWSPAVIIDTLSFVYKCSHSAMMFTCRPPTSVDRRSSRSAVIAVQLIHSPPPP